jgi:hypothetical protein
MKKLIILFFIFPLLVFSQSKTLFLKPEKLGVSSRNFYIVEVEDARKTTSNIGRIWDGKQQVNLLLDGGTANGIQRFLEKNFNHYKTDTLTAIYLIIKDLKIIEKPNGSYIQGELMMDLAFETYRDGQRIFLTSGKATSSYTRSVSNYAVLDPMFRSAIENQLKGFVKWFKDSSSSDKLAKKVQLVFVEDTAKMEAGDTVFYNKKRPLAWKDFKGGTKFGSRWAAQVFTSFGFEMRSSVQNRIVRVKLRTYVWLDKTISWVRPDAKNDYTLAHEQLHFDITKLVAERFKRKIAALTFTVEDFNSEIQYQYLEFYRVLSLMQEKYDGETNHGLNTADQARWIKKVNEELELY